MVGGGGEGGIMLLFLLYATFLGLSMVDAEDPYRFFDWNVTYGDIYHLGFANCMIIRFSVFLMDYDNVRILCFFLMGGGDGFCFQGILINGQFSGPNIMTISLSMSTTTCQRLSSSPGEKVLFFFFGF